MENQYLTNMAANVRLDATIREELNGERLDKALAVLFPDYSRGKLQTWIKSNEVTVNGGNLKPRDKVATGDIIQIDHEPREHRQDCAENIPLDVIHQDEQIIILNKPAGLVVHPGAGNRNHTLVNALLNFDERLAMLPRAGIVHRLDKDTSGIMMIARTCGAHTYLVNEIQRRNIKRIYQAVVCGELTSGGKVDRPISRHPLHRTKMAVVENGKPALTHYRIITKYKGYTHIRLILETGRTHQIRVHMASRRHPLVGDYTYGGRIQITKGADKTLTADILGFKRQALHAQALEYIHPVTAEKVRWQAPLPDDIKSLLNALEKDAAKQRD